jgi:4a-hydroxytetrahydrobiopterin dehydratase
MAGKKMRQKLSDLELQRALAGLPGWTRRGDTITRTFQLPAFMDVINAVNRIAQAAERRNHHPDIDIRYNKLTISLSTHDAGGVTMADVELGEEIGRIVNGE